MRHKVTIEVGEDFVSRIMVDGQLVGLVQRLELSMGRGDSMPVGKIELLQLDKHQGDIITALKEIPWLKVDDHP
jgi:hypothetical protein